MSYEITQARGHCCVRLFGVVSAADLLRFGQEIERIEDATPDDFDRIVDFTGVDDFAVGFLEVNGLAQRRRERRFRNPVKVALVAIRPNEFGYARMYQTLNDHPMVAIRIVSSLEAAVTWLSEPASAAPADPP